MRAILVRRRENGRIVRSCYGIDLAVVSPTPLRHPVRIERDLVDEDALPSKIIQLGNGGLLELFETARDLIVA